MTASLIWVSKTLVQEPLNSVVNRRLTSKPAEEVDDAAIAVPRTMIWSIIVSGILSIGISIAILFCISDVDAALTTPNGFPIIEIFFNETKSFAKTNAVVSALIISFFFSALGLLASGSRLI